MIGILIISHSAAIAGGVRDLAAQMAQGRVPIAAAGGTHDGDLGTSADLISEAIAELHEVEAVLALVDMGSAVMSAEMALELSGRPFLLSGAPLVEGALVAAVEATRPGVTLYEVARAAARALDAKGLALAPNEPTAEDPSALDAPPITEDHPAGVTAEVMLTIFNQVGLHMRPAKEFVQIAARFACEVRVRNLDRPERAAGNAKSILDVMKIGVTFGQRIHIQAEGDDAHEAVAALTRLVNDNFGEAV